MKFHIDDTSKARIVAIGSFPLFGNEKNRLDREAKIRRFDEVWRHGLQHHLEEAIRKSIKVSPDVVKRRLEGVRHLANASKYVDPRLSHYEFTYESLCIAQVERSGPEEFRIDQLWCFTYNNKNSRLFCFEFDTEDELEEFRSTAKEAGLDPSLVARQAVMDKMREMVADLQSRKSALEADLARLEEQARKSNVAYYRAKLSEFSRRLTEDHPETAGNSSWQEWIFANTWLFGTQYGKPIPKQRVGFSSIPDFLFPTIDGFVDVLEIKKPTADLIKKDHSHAGAFAWAPPIAQAIGQVVTYLHEIDMHQLQITKNLQRSGLLEPGFDIHVIRPRAFILAGRSSALSKDEREALRKLNYSLHCIEVITYDDLLQRGERLVSLYTNKIC